MGAAARGALPARLRRRAPARGQGAAAAGGAGVTQAGRRSVRAGAALLLAAVPLALAAWTGGPGPTAALATDDEGDGSPVAVTIVGIDPVAPQPRSMVDVTVDVTNTGAEALDHYD